MKVNVTRADNRTNKDELIVVVAPANFSDTDMIEGDHLYIMIQHKIKWNVKVDSMVFNINFIQYEEGLYRVGLIKIVKRYFILLGVVDNIRINKPFVSINLPKKEFFQGEAVTLTINNPYINLTYESKDLRGNLVSLIGISHYGHQFTIVPTYPSIYEKRILMTTNSSQVSESCIVPYEQDAYKIMLERIYGNPENAVAIAEVQNSTFTVKRNYPTLDVDNAVVVGGDCSMYRIRVSLTTMNNIPLKGPYVVGIVEDGKESDCVRANKTMMVKAGALPTTRLNATISFRSSSLSWYRARIMIDHKLWALSEAFYAGCI